MSAETEQREDYLYEINHCQHYWPASPQPSSLCGGCGREFGEVTGVQPV